MFRLDARMLSMFQKMFARSSCQRTTVEDSRLAWNHRPVCGSGRYFTCSRNCRFASSTYSGRPSTSPIFASGRTLIISVSSHSCWWFSTKYVMCCSQPSSVRGMSCIARGTVPSAPASAARPAQPRRSVRTGTWVGRRRACDTWNAFIRAQFSIRL